jgi:hypothetical protein
LRSLAPAASPFAAEFSDRLRALTREVDAATRQKL